MAGLFRFLGVNADIPLQELPETIPQSTAPLSNVVVNYRDLEYAFRHTSYAKYLPPLLSNDIITKVKDNLLCSEDHSWGHLVPICSFSSSFAECQLQLKELRDSLLSTTSPSDRASIACIFGVDKEDSVYDT